MSLTRAQRIIRSQYQSLTPTTPDTSILDLSGIPSSDPSASLPRIPININASPRNNLEPRGHIKVKMEPTIHTHSLNMKQVKVTTKMYKYNNFYNKKYLN